MNKESKTQGQNKENQPIEVKAPVPCKFEELNDEFLIQREIGRGKFSRKLFFPFFTNFFSDQNFYEKLNFRVVRCCFQGNQKREEAAWSTYRQG